jgi:hypothetical protein
MLFKVHCWAGAALICLVVSLHCICRCCVSIPSCVTQLKITFRYKLFFILTGPKFIAPNTYQLRVILNILQNVQNKSKN